MLAGYDEPHRSYHTRTHLGEMLAALGHLLDPLPLAPREVLLARSAAWFHDAVYDPVAPAGANERASADLAVSVLTDLGAPVDLAEEVGRLVLATADHRLDPTSAAPAAAALLDADLWILAAPAQRFDAYCAQVRQEYAVVDDATYAAARAAILRDLVERPRLYLTDAAHREWTDAARANVAREIARLGAGRLD